jgi:hypothetical protein
MRFRAGMPINFNSNGARRIPPSSSDSCSSEGFCDELDESDYVQITPEGSCKPFPPISRIPALNDAVGVVIPLHPLVLNTVLV